MQLLHLFKYTTLSEQYQQIFGKYRYDRLVFISSLNTLDVVHIIGEKEVHPMLKKKHYLYLDDKECGVLIKSLVQMKNRLIQEGHFTDCVDELILKILSAPLKRV